MPSYRKPKGVRTLLTGDWFYANGAAGGGFHSPAAGNDAQVALFNDSQVGEWLYVYGIQAIPQVPEWFWYYMIEGTIGSFFGNCFGVVCDAGVPRGQIFTGEEPSLVPAANVTFPIISEFQSTLPSLASGPIAVVKPGYSLVCQTADDFHCSFNYLVIGN